MTQYADLIDLDVPYFPAAGSADLNDVIDGVFEDNASIGFTSRYSLPSGLVEQRKWVQAALTVRNIGPLSEPFVHAVDRLLQHELQKKSVIDSVSLPRLEARLPASEHLSIWDGDITALKIDAITNAANSRLLGCFQPFHSCVDNAIQCAAGPQLREDCAKIMNQQSDEEPTGGAKITRGYNLPSRFILHTVGPIIIEKTPTIAQSRELESCYRSCLSLAASKELKSVAFCAISTGVFGYPSENAAKVALRSVSNWLVENPGLVEHVVFCTFGKFTHDIYKRTVASWT